MVDVGELSLHVRDYITKRCGDVIEYMDVMQTGDQVIISLKHSAADDKPYVEAFDAAIDYNVYKQQAIETYDICIVNYDSQEILHKITLMKRTDTVADIATMADLVMKLMRKDH